METQVEIDAKELKVSLKRSGNRVVAEVEGRRYDLTLFDVEPGVYLVLFNNQVYEYRVDKDSRSNSLHIHTGNISYNVNVTDPRRWQRDKSSIGHGSGHARIVAPMPGKVVRVMVEVGSNVSAGQGIVVVEAMKMQNEIKTSRDGKVVEILVETGSTVNAGDLLAVIEG
jgi:biotin carboxyl carrier protein